MNARFTILVAAGLLFAGITQAQGTVAADNADFKNPPHHTVMNNHRAPKHQVKHHKKHMKHHHRMHRHHKMNHGHR